MVKCPRDADNTENPDMCKERLNDKEGCIFICTRKKGHKGQHHAHGGSDYCCNAW